MSEINGDISIRIEVLNPKRHFLGGTVDIEIMQPETGHMVNVKGADASKRIDVGGLQRIPQVQYQVAVIPTDVPQPTSQVVTIPATGFATLQFIIEKGASGRNAPPNSERYNIKGNLVFDHGLAAAAIMVRLFHIGFGGQRITLGEVKSDSKGDYSFSYSPPGSRPINLQVRVVDSAGNEITISATKFNASQSETLNLVVPASVRSLAPEFQRLSSDMKKSIGGIAKLSQAQEGADRQDLTLLNQTTNWDARLIALAATAAQEMAATGLSHEVLYALLRVGLPSDPLILATVPSASVQEALEKANQAGIVNLSDREISAASASFQDFSKKTLLASTAPGTVSQFNDLLTQGFVDNPTQQAAFASLFFGQSSTGADLWTQAASLKIPAATLDALKLQGKFLYLTLNNAPLTQRLQREIGSLDNLSKIADKDYYKPETWQSALTSIAGTGGDKALQALIPPVYVGHTTAERLVAYTGDLARKVRISFPTQVTARMIENKELPVRPAAAANVSAFLRTASTLGYQLGRTPLNSFLVNSAKSLPSLDETVRQSVKSLHRLFQITPSTESLQSAMKLGFTSAFDIASYSKDDFLNKYDYAFPPGEASLVYGQAQTVSSVTFNVFSMATQLDSSAPLYALSGSSNDRQNAKNALVQQFPSMASLFGNLDFCQCQECRSVLSPAAYFVDVLDLLGQQSAPNAAQYTPLDVLIGKDKIVPGLRPDLGALPLTCENTNTAMPYIDLVNEILEYYIGHSRLDGNAAYDTGSAATADLIAEPQHIVPEVYNSTLKQAFYPLDLPFDLWIETVRGFLDYFNIPLARVLDTLRPADTLELFSSTPATPYYRAQILAEALGISPAEYAVFTAFDTSTWFNLYGSPNEIAALNDLKSAKTLSQRLGLSYQDLTDLTTTGFLNPALYALIFQFERFGIDLDHALSFTNQPGCGALSTQEAIDFGNLLDGVTAQIIKHNETSTFNARDWLNSVLPANYSRKVLVLADPDTGCNFSGTELQYADRSAATPLDFLKFNLFVRLWKKLGWTMDETDRTLQAFFPPAIPAWTSPGFAAAFGDAWKTTLVYLAHLDDLNTRLSPALGRVALLPLWTNLPSHGQSPLYAQLFLTVSVLNDDWSFDDPNGHFPWPVLDMQPALGPLFAHGAAIQGVLGLTAAEISAILNDAGVAAPTAFSLANLSICYRYSLLAQSLQLSVADMIALKTMSGLNPFKTLEAAPLRVLADDILLDQTLAFVQQVAAVRNSGFSVEDLKYLLRHQFDPVGKYQNDPNALIALAQSIFNGLLQIHAQNAVPANLLGTPESLIDQSLSGLFPATILKTLFTQLANSQTYIASQDGVLAPIDATPFSHETLLAFSYDPLTQTQTVGFKGLLLDWKKAQLEEINTSGLFSGLLDAVQQQAQLALHRSVGDILGVWASMGQYEAVITGVLPGHDIADPLKKLAQADASLSFSYDQSDQLQWLGYRGVLTDVQNTVLTGINNSPTLAALLTEVQQQTLPAYRELIGSLLAILANGQTYRAAQAAVTLATQVDAVAFAAALAQAQENGTITDPVPEIQFSYTSTAQIQALTCNGVLTDAVRLQLAGLIPSQTLPGLLQTVRSQAVQLFQTLAKNLLSLGVNDLDIYLKPFLGVNTAKQQNLAKGELVKVFFPLLTQKLSRQLVLQTLSASLESNPSLTEALVTDAALLNDPNNPGKSLLKIFLAIGKQGVSATYYLSTNLTGTPPAIRTATTTDTADPANDVTGTASCHFEGYLQVLTDGPYRFFAELGNLNAQVAFRLDSPDPTALLPNPTIQQIASKDEDEASQYVQLKGGVAYPFTLDFQNLGANGARLLIQGENLPKGPLSQILLFPQEAVSGFIRANVLLSKVLQILKVTGLDEREVSYLTAHAAQFNNLRLSALPAQAKDDSVPKSVALFSQFLTLADYAELRNGAAGGTGGLVDVFQAASQSSPPMPPWTILANLTRRDTQVVQDVAKALGPHPHFVNNAGIRRIWEALQLVQIVRLPVASLSASAALVGPGPAAPDAIAASFKNAVKAQYSPDLWRPIAKSVFDNLRQKKRDALVSYLVNALELENANQLFEHFLVDPGMEPVVQTSRLRLAISSVQTFVQRCLLNLENGNTSQPARNVEPRAIPADRWEWMKRYRVWQANREIFLFPENWMEPELRLDKTDLFQVLESDLLQGDVTRDLVEDAFLTYLKGLDVRARLDIVASYLDQDVVNAELSTLHVLGRTYRHPHKFFHRTYFSGAWSGWEAVIPDIESDHIALAIWRGRLNLFWLTFIPNPQPPATPPDGTNLANLFSDSLASTHFAKKQVQIQLHWSELLQGEWSIRTSTDINKFKAIIVPDLEEFDPSSVHIHVSKEGDDDSAGAIRIHADFPYSYAYPNLWPVRTLMRGVQQIDQVVQGVAFRVTSKNCDPDCGPQYWQFAPSNPYSATAPDATFYAGSSSLTCSFRTWIQTDGSSVPTSQTILNSVSNFALLTTSNPVEPSFLNAAEPLYMDAGGLVSPFFFKDTSNPNADSQPALLDERTFFVLPSLTEIDLGGYNGYAVPPTMSQVDQKLITVVSQVPAAGAVPVNLGDPVFSLFPMQDLTDWATGPSIAFSYGGVAIGRSGGIRNGSDPITLATSAPAGGASASTTSGAASPMMPGGFIVVGKQGLDRKQAQAVQTAQAGSRKAQRFIPAQDTVKERES